MISKILQIGNPKLRIAANPTSDFNSDEVKETKQNLVDTLRAQKSGVAISAIQIGSPLNLFLIEIKPTPNRPELKPLGPLFFFNPEITWRSAETIGMFEACLSIMNAEIFGEVTRPKEIKLKYRDETGAEQEAGYDDFLARVIQHEVDHLQGKLFTDIVDTTTLQIAEEYRKMLSRKKQIK